MIWKLGVLLDFFLASSVSGSAISVKETKFVPFGALLFICWISGKAVLSSSSSSESMEERSVATLESLNWS